MAELEKFNPAELAKVQWIEKRDKLIKSIQKIEVVDSAETLEVTGKMQVECRKLIKEIGEARLSLTRPLDKRKKEITAQEKELVADLESAMNAIKAKNSEYATRVAAEAEAERQRIAAEERKAAEAAFAEAQAKQDEAKKLFGPDAVIADEPIEIPQQNQKLPTGKVKTSSNRMVTRWNFDIIDSALIPREFLSVDESKIRAYMNSQVKLEQDPVIPGVRFGKTVNVESRG